MNLIKCFGILFLSVIFLNGCASNHRGYKLEDETINEFKEFVNNKASVHEIIDHFGSPSFVNSPINDTICYVNATGKRLSFNKFFRPKYKILCVILENEIAKNMTYKSLDAINEQSFLKMKISLDKKPI